MPDPPVEKSSPKGRGSYLTMEDRALRAIEYFEKTTVKDVPRWRFAARDKVIASPRLGGIGPLTMNTQEWHCYTLQFALYKAMQDENDAAYQSRRLRTELTLDDSPGHDID